MWSDDTISQCNVVLLVVVGKVWDGMGSISKQTLNLYRKYANYIGYALIILGLARTDQSHII